MKRIMDLIKASKSLLHQSLFSRKEYFSQLDEYLQTDLIIVVQGQRRSGKSYCIMGYLQQKQIDEKEIFYLNKELDVEQQIQNYSDLQKLFTQYQQEVKDPSYIVIDEIQDIHEREHFIRARYTEKKYKIIISGSNSKLLSGELSTYLAGRYLSFHLYPFGYQEFLEFNQTSSSFLEYFQYGGLPEIAKIKERQTKTQYLKDIFDSILLKDIFSRFQIKDIPFFQKILLYLADNIGNPFSLRNVQNFSKNCGWWNASLEKISHYLQCLEIPFLIHKVPFYDLKGKQFLEYGGKYYFNDLGMRNVLKFNFNDDKGKLLENLVFLHLKRYGYEVFIGKMNNLEIDFVAKKENNLNYFQVAYTMEEESTKQREFWNLLKIPDSYPKYVISVDPYPEDYQGIKHLNIEDFLKHFR